MTDLAASLRAKTQSPETRKVIKYSMVSVVSVVVTTLVQFVCLKAFTMGPTYSPITASVAGAIPSYYLNRSWVWGKSGRSHLRKEVIPFWIMFVIGLAFSLGASNFAAWAVGGHQTGWQSFVITAASFMAYGLLWVLKYVIFNKILFVHREDQLDPVLDGRSGIPT